jgi:RNA polymerase sigma factor for flagellar operon FliA
MDYLSRQQREKVNDLFEARKELEAKLGRPPTVLEVSQKMGITTGQADETLAIARSVASLSLDRGSGDEGTKEMGDLLRNPRAPDPVEEASLHETKERLARAVAELPATERNVIVLYYDRGLLLREIAETLGVTESRVSQIHSRAILRLNEALREEGGEGTGGKAQRPERSRGGPAGAGPESARAGARA